MKQSPFYLPIFERTLFFDMQVCLGNVRNLYRLYIYKYTIQNYINARVGLSHF